MARDRAAASGRAAAERGRRMGRAREQLRAAEGEARDTRRVVLRRERVLVVTDILPDDASEVKLDELPDIGRKRGGSRVAIREAWCVVGEFDGDTPRRAIEAHAGKPGTPDAKPGVYKAPTVKAWKGGRRYEKPPEPKVEAEDIE